MNKKIWIWTSIVLVSLLTISCTLRKNLPEEPIITPPVIIEPEFPIVEEPEVPVVVPEIVRHPFNGEKIDSQQPYQAFAIMISNSKEARPHSGISLADIVYEVTMDGWSITRFMAVFTQDHPTKLGPVRSVRLPFVEILKEFKIPFAHFGSATTGQGDALTVLKSIKLPIRFDGHKGLNDEFFSRDSSRIAPHNAYFNAKNALVKIPSLEYEPRFLFDDTSNVNDESVSELIVKYSSYNTVKYVYDPTTEKYLRYINGINMMDTYTNTQVSVKNIILLHAPHRDVEAVRYIIVDYIGEGKAEFYVNGKYEQGTWKQADNTKPTQYFDSSGEQIILSPGNTWIQVVHSNVSISQKP
jgi:hypothetical protein